MMNYNEMVREFTKRVAEIEGWTQDDWDYIKKVEPKLENGDGYKDCCYFEEIVYYKNSIRYEIINITEYSEPIYDADGEIEDYKIIGYEID